eukprot:650966_1
MALSTGPHWLLPTLVVSGITYILFNTIIKKKNTKPDKVKDNIVLSHSTDYYNGIRIDTTKLPTNKQEFEFRLSYSLNKWKTDGFRGCWIKLTKPLFAHLPFCVSLGFNIHHAKPEYVMLETWLPNNEETMIPSYAFSYCGAHAFVLNNKNQLVVMREHYGHQTWKIPGGAIDYDEHASDAAVREAKEETGLDCEFLGVLCVRHLLNFRFGNTCDISFICVLRPMDLNQKLDPIHDNEVMDIKWMDIDEFISSEKHLFLGKEKENLELLKSTSQWVSKYWDEMHSKEAIDDSPCMMKYKQTHPFRKNSEIALYHR